MINVLDIGSNTIRLVTYNKGMPVSNSGLNSDIIADTKNGILSKNGIDKLSGTVKALIKDKENEQVYAFGTYAMRVLRNKNEVKSAVLKETGIDIDILSGKQEAEYDFYGLLSTISKEEKGIGVDLGGGSAQILVFDDGKLTASASRPIGCKRIKNRFSKGKFITKSEREEIKKFIYKNLEIYKGKRTKKIYMMGGTAKAALRLHRFLKGVNADIMTAYDLEMIIKYIEETDERVLKRTLSSRYDNIVAGIVTMSEIAAFFGAERIHIKKCGVRDGYVAKIEAENRDF